MTKRPNLKKMEYYLYNHWIDYGIFLAKSKVIIVIFILRVHVESLLRWSLVKLTLSFVCIMYVKFFYILFKERNIFKINNKVESISC